ncbi:MAG: class I SAM-dependent methyltransferase [bacterium]
MINLIFFSAVFVIYLIFGFYWLYAMKAGAPYYPSSKKAIKELSAFINQKKLRNGVELGSGDGRISLAITKIPDVKMLSIEINPMLTIIHRFFKLILRRKQNLIVNTNFFKLNYSQFDFAIMYLYPGTMKKLEDKLFQEMKSGSYLISNTFKFYQHQPIQTLNNKIFIYQV